jgi:uncharacterized protein YndB with AHSA1/START domain
VTNAYTDAETTLRLSRTYPAPRERVFAAWLDAETMRRFLGPRETACEEVVTDARVGGGYHIVMNTGEGPWTVRGTYLEIRPPERIVFTWSWDEDDAALAHESRVTLEFFAHDDGTELVLTHDRLRDVAQRDAHRDGWSAILDQLDAVLA